MAAGLEHGITDTLGALKDLDREALLARWRKAFPGPVPKHLSRQLMVRALAWQLQASASGGLSTSTARKLRTLARGKPEARGAIAPLPSGSRLAREWNGRTHMVDVSEDGYVWQGRNFRSLTAVAREITGAHWSGPRFFGLKARAGRP